MARPKKQVKAKEPVRVRFKELSNGNKSIYLDIYRDGVRSYEFLKMYLVPEKSSSAKIQNEQILAAANAIKARRIIELSNNEAGIKVDASKSKILFSEWIRIYLEKKSKKYSINTMYSIQGLANLLAKFGDNVPIKNVDKEYCTRFIDFLRQYKTKKRKGPSGEEHESQNFSDFTICCRIDTLTAILNAAVSEGLISANPIHKIDKSERVKRPESTRTFLTIEEVKTLINTPSPNTSVKKAFLFSCFCGLRYSDIKQLTWGNIEETSGRYYVNIVMQKTQTPLYLPLNEQALEFLPDRKSNTSINDLVFEELPNNVTTNRNMRYWCSAAGITKKVSFHVARHTFATLSLTLGADLYTTSKLLGHTNISTTQIYAKIVNEKKNAAVDLFNKAF